MTRSNLLPAALAALVFAAAATPAFAASIKHTNRAEGDPDAAPRTTGRAAPAADTTGPHYFDKLHQDGNHG